MTAVLFTCAGQRVDIVTAFGRAGATTIAADVDQLAPALYHADRRALVPRVDDPAYIDALRDLVQLHDVRLIVPLTDLDHLQLAQARDELGGATVLATRPPSTIARCSDKYLAHAFFEEQGIGSPPTWLPTEAPGNVRFPVLVKARKGFGSRHIYRADERDRARVLPPLHDRRLDGAGRLPRRGVLDRRLLRPRLALPRCDPAHDDRVEGRRINQGHDDQGHGAGRVRRARRRGARRSSARRTSSASASRAASCRSPTSTRASAAAFRCRRRPARATRSSRSRSRTASTRSRGSATSARAWS